MSASTAVGNIMEHPIEASYNLEDQGQTQLQGRPELIDDNIFTHGQEFSLPRADGGMQAWLFLAGCFATEALVWGFPFSFGVFQVYYCSHEIFSQDVSLVALIGTSATVR